MRTKKRGTQHPCSLMWFICVLLVVNWILCVFVSLRSSAKLSSKADMFTVCFTFIYFQDVQFLCTCSSSRPLSHLLSSLVKLTVRGETWRTITQTCLTVFRHSGVRFRLWIFGLWLVSCWLDRLPLSTRSQQCSTPKHDCVVKHALYRPSGTLAHVSLFFCPEWWKNVLFSPLKQTPRDCKRRDEAPLAAPVA